MQIKRDSSFQEDLPNQQTNWYKRSCAWITVTFWSTRFHRPLGDLLTNTDNPGSDHTECLLQFGEMLLYERSYNSCVSIGRKA